MDHLSSAAEVVLLVAALFFLVRRLGEVGSRRDRAALADLAFGLAAGAVLTAWGPVGPLSVGVAVAIGVAGFAVGATGGVITGVLLAVDMFVVGDDFPAFGALVATPVLVGYALRRAFLAVRGPLSARLLPGERAGRWPLPPRFTPALTVAARLSCLLPFVAVVLVPMPGASGMDHGLRIATAALLCLILYFVDLTRRVLPRGHRQRLWLAETSLWAAIAVMSAGPFGALFAGWWARQPGLVGVSGTFYSALAVLAIAAPGWVMPLNAGGLRASHIQNFSRVRLPAGANLVALEARVLVPVVFAVLSVGLFHPSGSLLLPAVSVGAATVLVQFGTLRRAVQRRQAAAARAVFDLGSDGRDQVLAEWADEVRPSGRRKRTPTVYWLPDVLGALAVDSVYAVRPDVADLPWEPTTPFVVPPEQAGRLLAIAEHALDLVGGSGPALAAAYDRLGRNAELVVEAEARRAAASSDGPAPTV
ncbi:hypothetical protein [Actinokineospora enzanensis]|uniref:hypothetical protein n=1 Tax=Actinokineospora enzanensis TaxID=155975 RepID=UPI00035CB2FE|nr:hypothetical protein [Actinokineospora enzanensis]